MTGPHQQWFHFGVWVFSIDTALALITAAPRGTQPLDVATWAHAYGLNHLDDPDSRTIGLIGPMAGSFDRGYAMATDLTNPIIVAQLPLGDGTHGPLLIDGTHRLYRAWREAVPRLPAYLLTADETRQTRHDARLGPDRRRTPPR